MTKFGRNNILYTGCTYVTIQMIFQLYEQKGGNGVHKGGFQSRVRADGGCSVQFLHHLFKAQELLAMEIASIHNLAFYLRLVGDARQHIENGDFTIWKRGIIQQLAQRV